MNKLLKELEIKLNDYWKVFEKYGEEFYTFRVKKCNDNRISVKCINDDKTEAWKIETEYVDDMAALITHCISDFYEAYINPYNRVVKAWKRFVNSKVRSLGIAMEKNKQEKINEINLDMIEHYKKMCDAKFQVNENKKFVSMFYIIKT